MKQIFLLLLLICLLLSCNSRKGKVNSKEVFVFLRMDYEVIIKLLQNYGLMIL